MPEKRQIFRQESLDRLSSPDRLDQILRIVKPQTWLVLGALGIGVAAALTWSIVGKIPVTANGTAMLVKPKQVVAFQTPASGRIAHLDVEVGEMIHKGDVLGQLHLPDIQKQLEQERTKLELFEKRTGELDEMEESLYLAEKEFLDSHTKLVEDRIKKIQANAEIFKDRSDKYIAQQSTNIATAKTKSEEFGQALKERLEAKEKLRKDEAGVLVSADTVVDARSRLIENELRLAELAVDEEALKLQQNSADESYAAQMDLIDDLTIQLGDMKLRDLELQRKLRVNDLDRESEREAIVHRIEWLEDLKKNEGNIVSEHDGRVLEVTVTGGQHVAVGQRLGKVEIEDENADLMVLAYFEVKDGKKINLEDGIRVTPATVQRERFGGIEGTVTRVSDYPVTTDAAAHQIGDIEMARNLLSGQSRIEVLATLAQDDTTHTGLKWTFGKGPDDIDISPGTTAKVRVTTEERRPIMLLLPFLNKFFEKS